MVTPLYTIGYGNRPFADFISLLQRYSVAFLVDVRSRPQTSYDSHYLRTHLEQALEQYTMRYVFMGDTLGGRPADERCYTDGKVDYSKLRAMPFYLQGIARLQTAWEKQVRAAIMCSELKPEECHRSKLIGNTLRELHIDVAHIDENGELKGQEEVNTMLTAGQLFLFEDSPIDLHGKIGSSRKKRQP